jgi:hypothetical protein
MKTITLGETSMLKNLTELANNPNLISGIYNYCDRWCERCPLTSRCLVYATESESTDNVDTQNNDIRNAAFWQTLSETLADVRQLIPEWAKQTRLDLDTLPQKNTVPRRSRQVDNHPLTKAAKQYANSASDWFRELEHNSEMTLTSAKRPTQVDRQNPPPFEETREVIHWYQYQIAVKTMRALSGCKEEIEDPEIADFPRDSDGYAKVALIGIDRSIAAWRLMQLSLSDRTESIVPLILQLETLRINLEESFPEARPFIRPGFDSIPPA